ncbi:MAG: chitobiase/beta-hexosaminidase C-terminal domain-containing protein [Clostridia bacterium]|nr:chitobiase/beta-hexosaminidase C-terminal domain-containing protein [Clostridia bacterium]
MKCSACGEENAPNARFCSYCGARLSAPAAEAASESDPAHASASTARPVSDNPYQPRRMPKIHADTPPEHEEKAQKVFLFDDEREAARHKKRVEEDPFFDDEDDEDDSYDDDEENTGRGGKIFIGVISIVTVLILALGAFAFLFYTPTGSRLRAYYGLAAGAEDFVVLGDWQLQNGNEAEAAVSYYNAFLLKRDDFDFSLNIAQNFERCGANERAEQLYMYLIDQYPMESDPYDYLMALLVKEGKLDEYNGLLAYRAEHQPGYVIPTSPDRTIAPPALNPEGGTFTGSVHITMTAEEGSDIYFTIDGSQPTKASRRYTGPVILYSGVYTVRAAAFSPEGSSEIVEITYSIS